jgi:PAS domain S-box-containing protein
VAEKLWVRGDAEATARARDGAPLVRLALRSLDRHRAAEEAEARYSALLEASFEGLCVHIDGRTVEVNPALAEIYGYTRDEMLGMDMAALAAPEILPRIRKIVSSGYTGSYETIALCKDGTRVPLEARGKGTVWRGQPARVAAFRDLRERKETEAALVAAREAAQEASRTKSRFLANMSHEIRTPMNGVLGMVHLLLDGELAPDQRERAEIIRSSAVHLLALLNDILDLSRVEAGALQLAPEAVPLRSVIDPALASVRATAETKGLALGVRMASELPAVWRVDPLRLRQVLVNLASNAVRHTARGRVRVSVRRWEHGLRFRVSDTGEGMSQEQQAGLFRRFATSSRAAGGSGLGLNICQELVGAMGGTLTIDSAPGEGTTVTFTVRCQPAEQGDGPSRTGPGPHTGPARSLRVLVVDDNALNQLIVGELLRRAGHEVDLADDGEQAVAQAQAQAYDLILMDVQMPVMDGLEATRQLRAAGLDTPIVALTAHAMAEDRTASLEAGMGDHLTKPVEVDQLARVLASLGGRVPVLRGGG